MVRQNNQLPSNLPQLQNLIKRDPQSYKDEVSKIFRLSPTCDKHSFQFLQQYNYFLSTLEVFKLQPDGVSRGLDSLVMFIASVSHCYSQELAEFPQIVMDLLKSHHMVLNADLRLVILDLIKILYLIFLSGIL